VAERPIALPPAKRSVPNGLSIHPSNLRDGCCLLGRMAALAVAGRKMRRRIHDHATMAQRYANCADESIRRGNNAINETERRYHILISAEYLLLAERELRAGYRQKSAALRTVKAPRGSQLFEPRPWALRERVNSK
jgi:hypothetical protein